MAIKEHVLGPDLRSTVTSLNNLSALLEAQGNLAGAQMADLVTLGVDHHL